VPNKRLSMRKIKEVLRLSHDCQLKHRAVARSCGIARSTVAEYLRRAGEAGLGWPLPEDLDEGRLEALLFPPPPAVPAQERPQPDWQRLHLELKRQKGVTLFLLWQEYKAAHATGYQYSRFCDLYGEWRGRADLVMRQQHRAGEKLFVDYAGATVPVVDRLTGEVQQAQIFVAVLGASSYTYCEATWTQSLPDWIGSHVRALAFLGGVTEVVVPDNLKAGVTSPHLYEPDLNPTYQEMARHYGLAVVPARAARPRDKAKVEAGVLLVERWILARLRKRTFFCLTELNDEIARLLEQLNEKPFQKLAGSRRSLYEELDLPALRPLPAVPYEFAEWKQVRAHIDYHVEVARHYYSVPYQLVSQTCEARYTSATVEIFHRGRRVASHPRNHRRGGYTTLPEHMPESHRQYAQWTPERLVRWAGESGEAVAAVAHRILEARPHPQQGYRACLGVMRLGKQYGPERLEAACRRALATGACSYKSLASILKSGLDRQPLPKADAAAPRIVHGNIRGPEYYAPALPLTEKGGRPC
jgi:transposase